MKKITVLLLLIIHLIGGPLTSQTLENQVSTLDQEIAQLDAQKAALLRQVEDLKLQMIRRDLKAVGLPSAEFIEHSAMLLEYSEQHEQAKWVAHIITPDIIDGNVFRTNDFREDPLITTGSATEVDYFLKYLQPDSTYKYDGFGYDRGHLAPSADFRWSRQALSESYFYSNMSPQLPDFNREGWAELEGLLRRYIVDHPETQLYVLTGPLLNDNLPVIERSVNKVSIPREYFKVVLDLKTGDAIGFLMPNATISKPLSEYAKSIDEIEALTGFDFFSLIDQQEAIESHVHLDNWFSDLPQGDVDPIYPPSLPRGHFNTEQAKQYMGDNKSITVVGKVVGTRYSRSGNLWFNLDKQFPNQIFSVYIRKDDLVNFEGDPQEFFEGQVISVTGVIQDFSGVPTVNVERSGAIEVFGE